MPATLNNAELVGLVAQRTRAFRAQVGRLEGSPSEAEILAIATKFKRLKDASVLMEARLNTALEPQNTTVDDL